MKRAVFFSLIVALLLVPCAVAYANEDVQADVNAASIEPADSSLAPSIEVFGNAIGGVSAGDLFLVDLSDTPVDTPFILSITNTDELVHSYRYMTLNIGIYKQVDVNRWEKVTAITGEMLPEMYITMQGGVACFTLAGSAKYKITIDRGCFKSYSIKQGEKPAIPGFYLATG